MTQFGTGQSRRLRIQSRNLLQANGRVEGGIAGASAFEVSFYVIPPETGFSFMAEAYHCDSKNQELPQPIQPKTIYDNSVRICVRPDEVARNFGITINSIDFWNFTRDELDLEQVAIRPHSKEAEDGLSTLICLPGSPTCAFRTMLYPSFFDTKGVAGGIGSVWLQYGSIGSSIARRLEEPVLIELKNRRAQEALTDSINERPVNFAGESDVGVDTPVTYKVPVLPEHCLYDQKVYEWWLEEEMNDRYMYIGLASGAVSLFSCCLMMCACCPFGWLRRRVKKTTEGGNIKVNIGVKSTQIEENHTSLTRIYRDIKNASIKRLGADSHANAVSSDQTLETAPHEDEELGLQRRGLTGDINPDECDVCFDRTEHPGTLKFIRAMQKMIKADPDTDFCPPIYKSIKEKISASEFYVGTEEKGYSKPSKMELIELIARAFAEEKGKLQRSKGSTSSRNLITDGNEDKDAKGLRKSNSMKRLGSDRSLKRGLDDKDDIKMKRSGSNKSLKDDLREENENKLERSSSSKSLKRGEEEGRSRSDKLKRSGSSRSLMVVDDTTRSQQEGGEVMKCSGYKIRVREEDHESELMSPRRSARRHRLKTDSSKEMKRSSSSSSLKHLHEDSASPRRSRRVLDSDKQLKRSSSAPDLDRDLDCSKDEKHSRKTSKDMKRSSSNRSLERNGRKSDDDDSHVEESRNRKQRIDDGTNMKRSSSSKSLRGEDSDKRKMKRSGSNKSLREDLSEEDNHKNGSKEPGRKEKGDSMKRSGSSNDLRRSPRRNRKNSEEEIKLKRSSSSCSPKRSRTSDDHDDDDHEGRSSRRSSKSTAKDMKRSSSGTNLRMHASSDTKSSSSPRSRNVKSDDRKMKRSGSSPCL
jgi:hypothetical protein